MRVPLEEGKWDKREAANRINTYKRSPLPEDIVSKTAAAVVVVAAATVYTENVAGNRF